nr:endoplasmic reticulum metallopeptidase 1-like [Onthophagus taurus]
MCAQRHKESTGRISYFFGLILIAVVGGLYGIIYAIDHTLPTPLELSDEVDNPEAFIAERARNYLKDLIKIGPRVTGHENNEILAVEYLIKTINNIIDNKHINQKITYDADEYSGSFFLDFKPNGAINVYKNIQNVVVKIHSKNDSAHSVLINTHFDTVPNSPGGSDDGINVAIALEIINKLSKLEDKPTHNIVFLFNGAEEAALCGSHAFITQHYLAKEISVFINLEATGAGGKEILFQTGPNEPWLLKYYDVPHPHANAGAEEVFQSNIIPSDTDFRIFRDYGDIVGYDFAYYKDGYRYHTKYDLEENIDFRTFQHTGDNILHLVKNLAEADELTDPKTEGGKTVFYDVFGLFFLNYSMEANVIFNSLLALLSITLLIWACVNVQLGNLKVSLLYITMLGFVILLGWFLATGIVLIVAVILDATNRSMSWYSSPGIIFPLYVAPTFGSMLITTIISNKVIRHEQVIVVNLNLNHETEDEIVEDVTREEDSMEEQFEEEGQRLEQTRRGRDVRKPNGWKIMTLAFILK